MGSNDIPPPHISQYVVPVCNGLLQIGGTLWTICYVLLARESIRTRSYGMPLFALAFNFGWEIVYALYVVESVLEQVVFTVWMVIDVGMVYGVLKYGIYEWEHSPIIKRNLGWILMGLVAYCCVGHWAFAKWWIDNEVGKQEGKFYRGVVGPDTTQLGFWSAALAQAYLSVASLAQLWIRGHTKGVSWSIWATRTVGSVVGLYMNYGWAWYMWRDAHEYFMSPFGIFLWGTGLLCDLIYAFAFAEIKKTEALLVRDRRRAAAGTDSEGNKYK